jgi:predicted nucleotidyltransferase
VQRPDPLRPRPSGLTHRPKLASSLRPPILPVTILEQLRKEHPSLSAFDVKHLWLFGSAARGAANPRDVDILVEFNHPPGLLNYMNLKFRLEELLGRSVDLVSRTACRERFRRAIAEDLILVA